ncbi:MAG: regulatory protein RecX [Ostreibacterium sp.]
MFTANFNTVYHSAIRLLSYREHSQFELRQKLVRQGFSDEIITAVLEQLIHENYQSDERFVEIYCRSRVNQRYGIKKIFYELQQKGISNALSKIELKQYGQKYVDNALYLIERKAPQSDVNLIFSDKKIKNKTIRFLLGRGYDYNTINLAFECLLADKPIISVF